MLVAASAAFFALAGIFTRSITAGPWTIACWRGLVGATIIAAYVLWRERGRDMRDSLRLDIGGLGVAGCGNRIDHLGAEAQPGKVICQISGPLK